MAIDNSPRMRPATSSGARPQTVGTKAQRPQTAGATATRPQTAVAAGGRPRPRTSDRDSPRHRKSPYSPRQRLSPRTSRGWGRPQTAGEPFALHSSAWGLKPMPAGSPRCRGAESARTHHSGRDRESLINELVELKKLVAEQNRQLKRQKVISSAVEHENRKLERDILDLELKGISDALIDCDSPFLREKLHELKSRISFLQTACRVQSEELCLLLRDVRGTHTKELEMERDLFAEEAGCLQKVVRRLHAIHSRISSENKELEQVRDRNVQLEEDNHQLQANIGEVHNILEKVTQSLLTCRFKTNEASIASKRHLKKMNDLQRRSSMAKSLIQRVKDQKYRIQVRLATIRKKLEESKKELGIVIRERDKARALKMKELVEKQERGRKSPKSPKSKSSSSARTHQTQAEADTVSSVAESITGAHEHVRRLTKELVDLAEVHYQEKFGKKD